MEIKLNNISYNQRLNNIDYTFNTGNITCVIGESGSGKSLIGSIIMGLDKPTCGFITIDGKRNYDLKKLRKDIGYVFQNPSDHIFCSTVFDEVSFGLKQYNYKLDKINEQVSAALKMVGLDDSYLQKNPKKLSSGEVVRVAIASSLVLNPKYLILDEVYVYLDNNGDKELNKLLKKLVTKYNKGIIIMSNDIDNVSKISDNYLLLYKGRIVDYGNNIDIITKSNIFNKYVMEVSEVSKFIKLCRDKGIIINYTGDIEKLVMDVMENV